MDFMGGYYFQKIYENHFVSKTLRKEDIAEILYKDIFCIIIEALPEMQAAYKTKMIEFEQEGFSLAAVLIWYSFQREFANLGADNITCILNRFNDMLHENSIRNFGSDIFRVRYREYYPIIEKDLIRPGEKGPPPSGMFLELPFRGLAKAYYDKVAPNSQNTIEFFKFGDLVNDMFAEILHRYAVIKKNKIV